MFKDKNIHRLKYLITVVLNAVVTVIVYYTIDTEYTPFEVFLLLFVVVLVSFLMQFVSKFFFNNRDLYDGFIIIDVEDPNKDTITIEYLENPLRLADQKSAKFLVETRGI